MLLSEFGAPVTEAVPEKVTGAASRRHAPNHGHARSCSFLIVAECAPHQAGGQHAGAAPSSEPPLVDVSSYLSYKVDLYGDLLGDHPGQGTLLKTQVSEVRQKAAQRH